MVNKNEKSPGKPPAFVHNPQKRRSKDSKRGYADRDGKQFVLLPYIVLDSFAYRSLSYSARCLLVDICRQFSGSNNGKLVLCEKALKPRGWSSSATVHKGKLELIESNLICQTRQGYKPNKASWFAVTWLPLDWSPQMDITRDGFPRGAYLDVNDRPPKSRASASPIGAKNEQSNASLTPEIDAISGPSLVLLPQNLKSI